MLWQNQLLSILRKTPSESGSSTALNQTVKTEDETLLEADGSLEQAGAMLNAMQSVLKRGNVKSSSKKSRNVRQKESQSVKTKKTQGKSSKFLIHPLKTMLSSMSKVLSQTKLAKSSPSTTKEKGG